MAEGGPQMPYQGGFPGQFPAGYPANFSMPQMGNLQAEQLKAFWQEQLIEVSGVPADPAVFKNHQLPLARIKKIMKSDEDVRMISAEAPVLFAKACEMFILELTLRSWMHAEENKRRTLQRNDVAAAITKTDIFDFLIDIVPREDLKEGEGQAPMASVPSTSVPTAPAAPLAPVAVAPRPQGPASHPALGPASLYFQSPFPMTAGALGGDPAQAAAAAAAAAAMMRPPIPGMGVDPALVSLYQQQFLSGQAWPHIPGLPPPPTAQSAAAAAAVVHAHQQQAAAAAVAAVAQAAQQQQAAAAAAAAGAAQAANASSGAQAQGQGQGQAQQQTTSGAATSSGSQGPQNSGEQSWAGVSDKKS